MERVQAGEAQAFEEIWHLYRRLVYTTALKTLGRPSAAEDVTQMVFLKIWAKPAAFHGGSLGAWITRVSRNLAVDELRRSSGAVFAELDPNMKGEAALHELVFARIDAQRLYESLRMISGQRRILIELSFFEGKTHEEIAVMTSIPVGTVKTRIRAGIRNLRAAFLELQPCVIALYGERQVGG